MKNLTKAFVGTAAAAAMAVSAAATPAEARGKDRDNISAGEVIAGVAILGGIAAILSSDKDKDRGYDGYYHRGKDRYNRRGYGNKRNSARRAVNRCIRNVERSGSRYSRAQVTDIRDIKRTRYGYKVKGRLAVNDSYRGGNKRGYRGNYNRYDTGKFTCYVERGRVVDINYRGIRGY